MCLYQRVIGRYCRHGSADGRRHIVEFVDGGLRLIHDQTLHRIVAVLERLQHLNGVDDLIHFIHKLCRCRVISTSVLCVQTGQVRRLIVIVHTSVYDLQRLRHLRIIREDRVKAVLPVLVRIKSLRIPGVICQAEERHLR